jgi:DNA-binding response OmpR family regulator
MNAPAFRILLVEDNFADLLLTKKILAASSLNITLSHTTDARQALTDMSEQNIDLVVLDLNLPQFSGFDLLRARQANAICRQVPVCVLTTSRSERDRHDALHLGADHFASKPRDRQDYSELVASIERALTGPRRARSVPSA